MRYSTYNAIPQYPKSKKHPYENLAKVGIFLNAGHYGPQQLRQLVHIIGKVADSSQNLIPLFVRGGEMGDVIVEGGEVAALPDVPALVGNGESHSGLKDDFRFRVILQFFPIAIQVMKMGVGDDAGHENGGGDIGAVGAAPLSGVSQHTKKET